MLKLCINDAWTINKNQLAKYITYILIHCKSNQYILIEILIKLNKHLSLNLNIMKIGWFKWSGGSIFTDTNITKKTSMEKAQKNGTKEDYNEGD